MHRLDDALRTMRHRERGGIAVLTAIILVATFGFAAIAADGGLLYKDRSDDQNAADHAALAAAWAWCHGEDPIAAAHQAAADNGYNDDGATNDVKVANHGDGRIEVEIFLVRDPSFAGSIGDDALETRAWTVAKCTLGETRGSDGGAVFAHSETCPKSVDNSGSNNIITGGVHSNHRIDFAGSNNSVAGPTTYVTSLHLGGSGNVFNPSPVRTGVRPDPFAALFAKDKYFTGASAQAAQAAGRFYSAGSTKIDAGWLISRGYLNSSTGRLQDGLYVTTNDIDISYGNLTGDVTFVSANGFLKISGSDQNLTPFDPDGLLAASHKDTPCGTSAVSVSGSDSNWLGALYAPKAVVELSGSTNNDFWGALVGDEVRLNGSNLRVHFQDPGEWRKRTPNIVILE